MHTNVQSTVAIQGHLRAVIPQLTGIMKSHGFRYSKDTNWWRELKEKCEKNRAISQTLTNDRSIPMSFYCALNTVANLLAQDSVIVSEGANTMDIGRTLLPTHFPGHRLDAGTYGTMGVGLGFAIAVGCIKKFGGSKYGHLKIGPVSTQLCFII